MIHSKVETTISEFQKSQYVRLLDVFVIAPFLFGIAIGFALPIVFRILLILLALATIFYNGYNFLKNTEKQNVDK